MLFRDRVEAGKKLAQKLLELKLSDPLILAIPAGGVPVGAQIAKALGAPLDLMIARKIQFPWTTEAGFGAVVSDGTVYLGPHSAHLPRTVVEAQTEKARREVEHRMREFRGDRAPVDLAGKEVILVDDGLATGSTMLAAVQSVRKKQPKAVIVAVPTASGTAVKLLKPHVEALIALYVHPEHLPFAVASTYEHWYDLSDDEVKQYLAEWSQMTHKNSSSDNNLPRKTG
nr:phosphoribosyltransferase [Chloroflexota bacterium]